MTDVKRQKSILNLPIRKRLDTVTQTYLQEETCLELKLSRYD